MAYNIAMLLALGVLAVFFAVGASAYRSTNNSQSFFLGNKNISSLSFSLSYQASSTSLATVVMVFIPFAADSGMMLIIAPIAVILGAMIFVRGLFVLQCNLRHDKFKSLGALLDTRFRTKILSQIILLLLSIGTCSLIILEFYVGITIFDVFISENKKILGIPFSLYIVTIFVFAYVVIGGLPGVVRSDVVQVIVMWIAIAIAAWYLLVERSWDFTTIKFLQDSREPNRFYNFPIAAIINVVVINFVLLFSNLRTWQLIAASPTMRHARWGIQSGALAMAGLWTLLIFIGILVADQNPGMDPDGALLKQGWTLNQLLTTWANSPDPILREIIFPLLFCACIAALVSTGDSLIVSTSYTICHEILKIKSLLFSRVAVLLICVSVMSGYFVLFEDSEIIFIQFLLVPFTILSVLAVPIFGAICLSEYISTWIGSSFALVSIIVGYGLSALALDSRLGLLHPTMGFWDGAIMAAPTGVLGAAAVLFIGYISHRLASKGGESSVVGVAATDTDSMKEMGESKNAGHSLR